MAIIGQRNFKNRKKFDPNRILTVDTFEKVLEFAKNRRIKKVPLDVYKLAEELKIKILEESFDEEEKELSGILYEDSKKGWVIRINRCHHPNRKRYTVAHEIGHWCLHKHDKKLFKDKIFFRGGEKSKTEWQANQFASEILMPEDEFRRKVNSGITKVEDLAKEFKVSTIAVRIRAKKLGMRGHGL